MKNRFSARKRFVLFGIGLVTSGFGVALSTRPGMGTTPISSLPYVATFMVPWTLGMCTAAINILFILLQIAILRRRFPWFQLSQIVTVVLFGLCIDLGMWVSGFFVPQHYGWRVLMELAGCAVLAFGITCQLEAKVSYLPGDGLVRTVSEEFNFNFGIAKVCFDSSMVVLAVLISLVWFGSVEGIREGTLVAAVLVGWCIRFYQKRFRNIRRTLVKA